MKALYDLCADGCLHHIFTELFYDVIADIGLEKGLSDVAHGVGDVCLGDSSPAGQRLEYRIEFFGQRFKHNSKSIAVDVYATAKQNPQ